MNNKERLVRIQLCGVHEFSDWEIANSKTPKFVQCRKGCTLEWGECNEGVSQAFGFKIQARLVK